MKNSILRRKVFLLAALAFFLCQPWHTHLEARQVRILAVMSLNLKQYEEALEGFKESLSAQGVAADIETVVMEGDSGSPAAALKRAKDEGFQAVLTLGSAATAAARRGETGLPVVAALALGVDEEAENLSGVTLDIPFDVQFQWMLQILPQARRIGFLYDPARNAAKMEAAARAASGLGLTFFAQKVAKPSDLPEALDALSKEADALVGYPDPLIYTPDTAQHILLFSLKNRIPFIGLSAAWVKAGSLYALDCNYRDIGAQCADIVAHLLNGQKTAPREVLAPRTIVYSVNLRTASRLKIDIPEKIIQGADEVFR